MSGSVSSPADHATRAATVSDMALADLDIDAITEGDIAAAITEGLRRDCRVAFAPEAYNHPFVKDISSLANTDGGVMLIGIAEKDDVATGFAPLTGSPDTEMRQLAERLHVGITPQVAGVRLRALRLAGGGIVVVLHVPKSQQPPHNVVSPRDPRSTLIYIRVNSGAIELDPRALSDGWF